MTEYMCPVCGPKWTGAFNLDHRCVTCGSPVLATEAEAPVVKFMATGDHDLNIPSSAYDGAAAFDMEAAESVTLYPGEEALVGTGWAFEPPAGYAGLLMPRSGLGGNGGIVLGNLIGLIDPDYRGEIKAKLWYRHTEGMAQTIQYGDKIAQLMVVPYLAARAMEVSVLGTTLRGDKGFGSSGR